MDQGDRDELERGVRERCARGDLTGAATLALKGYGAEVFGFLVTMSPTEDEAADIFGEVSEALWKGLPAFVWECTLRTWLYAIARNRLLMHRRGEGRRRKRGVAVGESALEDAVQAIRSETLGYLRTANRTRLETLREALPEVDRALLVLRVDRQLAWNDLARILGQPAEDARASDASIAKEAAKLRKRFQVVKERLRDAARKDGLID
jgi:RNA polymerase sigma-70 factor (ECF subfamily)